MPDELAAVLKAAARRLRLAECGTPELDARLLLQAAAGLSREDMCVDPQRRLAGDALARFEAMILRRARREPVSRILGWREFYGRDFRLTPATLDPRPDTETMIAAALGLMPEEVRLLDLGTGTGAIAVTLLAERPRATGVATDVSTAALAVARDNAARHGVAHRLTLLHGRWFVPVSGIFDIILSNPPYIPEADIRGLSPDVRNFDPALALSGGDDGLDPYRAIAADAARHLSAKGHVLVEIGAGQAQAVTAIFGRAGLAAAGQWRDLGGHVRCLAFRHRS